MSVRLLDYANRTHPIWEVTGLTTMYQTLLFDVDNTLYDHSHSEQLAISALHHEYFRQQINLEPFKKLFKRINHTLWREVEMGLRMVSSVPYDRFQILCEDLHQHLNIGELTEYYLQALIKFGIWYEGAIEIIKKLSTDHQVAFITNGIGWVQRAKFSHAGLGAFENMLFISEEVGYAKPDARIFDYAITQLHTCAANCLMIGDSLTSDFAGAHNAGIDFCWANYQYQDSPTYLPAMKFSISNIHELTEILGMATHTRGIS